MMRLLKEGETGENGKEKEERKCHHLVHGTTALLEPRPHAAVEVIQTLYIQTMLLLTWGPSQVEYP